MTDDELFVAVLAQIERQPKLWRQKNWRYKTSCGTAHCFAGWALALNGIEFTDAHRVRYGDHILHVSQVARRLLGAPDACELFGGRNTLDDLYRISAKHMGIDEQVLRDKVTASVGLGEGGMT